MGGFMGIQHIFSPVNTEKLREIHGLSINDQELVVFSIVN
jgi:hypothetical protein